MTDRIKSLTVVLTHNIREDDVQCIVDAVSMIKGVLKVGLNVADPDSYAAQECAKFELQEKLRAVLWSR